MKYLPGQVDCNMLRVLVKTFVPIQMNDIRFILRFPLTSLKMLRLVALCALKAFYSSSPDVASSSIV